MSTFSGWEKRYYLHFMERHLGMTCDPVIRKPLLGGLAKTLAVNIAEC